MKSISILTFNLLVCCIALGQITITNADLPRAGTTFLVANDTNPQVSLGLPSGSWQRWDFGGLANHYPKVADYDSTALTPYAGAFPTSNVDTYGPAMLYSSFFGGAPVDSGYYGYMFWRNDPDGFWVVGWRAEDGPYANINVYENPTELLIGTPATYGTVYNNNARWELPLNRVPTDPDTFYITNITKTLSADAWGELVTPYGTFTDVLRIHEYAVELDSVRIRYMFLDTTFLFFNDTTNNYHYLIKGVGYPVAIAHADKNNVLKDVEFMIDSSFIVRRPPAEANQSAPRLFPNPASRMLSLEVPHDWKAASLVIYDRMGKETGRFERLLPGVQTLSVEDLAAGLYICRFRDAGGKEVVLRLLKE